MRKETLQPKRIQFAIAALKRIGITETEADNTSVSFKHKGNTIKLYAFTGWYSGKGVKDGRGIANLINELKSQIGHNEK